MRERARRQPNKADLPRGRPPYWAVVKWQRHWVLTPARAGSNPARPTTSLLGTGPLELPLLMGSLLRGRRQQTFNLTPREGTPWVRIPPSPPPFFHIPTCFQSVGSDALGSYPRESGASPGGSSTCPRSASGNTPVSYSGFGGSIPSEGTISCFLALVVLVVTRQFCTLDSSVRFRPRAPHSSSCRFVLRVVVEPAIPVVGTVAP